MKTCGEYEGRLFAPTHCDQLTQLNEDFIQKEFEPGQKTLVGLFTIDSGSDLAPERRRQSVDEKHFDS